MAGSVIMVGAVLTVALIVINLIILNATAKEKFTAYMLSLVAFIAGLLFLLVATFVDVTFIGAPLGGWGIASLFASALSFLVTSIADTYRNHEVKSA